MPNLSKKKGRRRFNPQREVKKAERILQQNKSDKFLKNSSSRGHSWQYGLQPNQVMSGSDKFFHKKFIKLKQSRGLADDDNNNNNNQNENTLNNDQLNLNIIENDQINRYQKRIINDNSDIDPSDSELDNDDNILNNINDNDDIFAFRRNKNNKDDQDEDEDELESSGDDLNKDYDDLLIQQNEDNDIDIDQDIKQNDDITMPSDLTQIQTKRNNKRGRRGVNINLNNISKQIMNDNNDDNTSMKRLLNLSAGYNDTKLNVKRLYDDSDNSSDFSSSDNDVYDDIEREKYKDNTIRHDDEIVEKDIGLLSWGNKRNDYYGADTSNKAFKSITNKEQYQRLRDEEAVAFQMQRDQLAYSKQNDYRDNELELLIENQMDDGDDMVKIIENAKQNSKQKQNQNQDQKSDDINDKKQVISSEFSSWFNDGDDNAITVQNDDKMDDDGDKDDMDVDKNDDANVEKITKDINSIPQNKYNKIINRDHPELPGMIKELNDIVIEMKDVKQIREQSMNIKYDDAIEDSTLFIELLRIYGSTLTFYLQLKANKVNINKKHDIYSKLLQLKYRVNSFRKIYFKSIKLMNNLPDNWNRNQYLNKKKELFEYEKEKQNEKYKLRLLKEKKLKKIESLNKRKLRKKKKREFELKKKLFREGFNKLNNDDNILYNADVNQDNKRRGITTKIFKSSGLKRYRTKGIPRVKARRKYEKKIKLWRRKGFKKYQPGKFNPQGRGEWNINTSMTHSKKFY